ncbi:hypothetical protein [Xanthomonas campestris]|uniref:hypothetical protein n=1 Tax=Xanthomonas campestris TaxID=339 RepID=UPI003CF2ACE3
MKNLSYSLIAMFVILFSDYSSACSILASSPPTILTEKEQTRLAELVIVGRVTEMQKVLKPAEHQHPYTFRLKITVEQWVKGSGSKTLEVFDTTGTGCDDVFGITHIAFANPPLGSKWKIYIVRHQGQLYVGNAKAL